MPSTTRPFARRLALVLVTALVGSSILVLTVGYVGRSRLADDRQAFEQDVASLDNTTRLREEPSPDDNAVSWFRRAAVADESTPAMIARRSELLAVPDWSSEQLAEARSLVEPASAALDLAARAVTASDSSFGLDPRAGFDTIPDDLLSFLRLRESLALRGRVALADGELVGALAATDALYRLRTTLRAEPLVVFQLLGFGVDWAHLDLVQRLLLDPRLDTDALDRLEHQLAADETRPVAEALATEAAHIVDVMLKADDDTRGLGRWARHVLNPWDQRAMLHVYRQLAMAGDEPIEDVAGFAGAGRPWSPVAWVSADILIPNLAELPLRYRASESCRQLARWALAARRHALEQTRYPETLQRIASQPPIDPYSGESPTYSLADGAPQVASPRAEALWADRHPRRDTPFAPRFTWRLPTID
ncbi:MAG: hypothetical protein AAGE94_09235 [Acidobacteriota bacterium]